MANIQNISTISIFLIGFLFLQYSTASDEINNQNTAVSWKVHWEYQPKCNETQTDECLKMHMDDFNIINLTISNLKTIVSIQSIRILSDSNILQVSHDIPVDSITDGSWNGQFKAEANFIGKANIYVEIIRMYHSEPEISDKLPVIIIRPERLIDTLFIVSVASLVSILYINFGAALDLKKVKGVLRRPIGPAIALFCHFLFLPLSSYVLGLLLFPGNTEMQLGLFFTGASPAGGASNTWTVILGGNLDLSVTMSSISTIAAFGLTPLWIFTLGRTIFESGNLRVPYANIASSVFSLFIPVIIGLLIQRYLPRVSRFLVRILKTCSILLIIFIIVFAIVTNLYLFKLFTWEIIVAGLLLPWLGYFVGWLAAVVFRQEYEDRMAIAVEAGIQNTGIAIFILRTALNQPEADLTTIMPVSVAIMTPFPLMAFYLCLKGRECYRRRRTRGFPAEIKECIESQESGVY